ncbi:MAG TPA: 2-hydroxyacyl-CoA dehydratase family protein [Clostridia bacterium]
MSSPYITHLRLSQGISKYLDLKSHQMILKAHYEVLKHGLQEGNPFIFTEVIMPPEIFHSMGIASLFVESLGSFMASVNMNGKIIKTAEDLGIGADICAYHKSGIGALKSGYIPVPAAFVHSSYWCDDMTKVCEYLSHEYQRPGFIIDLPFGSGPDAVDYVAGQFEKMAQFLSENTKIPFSLEKLKETVRLSNEARQYWVMANRLREEKPCLVYGTDTLRMLPMLLPKFGLPAAVDICRTYYDELLERRKTGVSVVKNGKYRLLWLHFFPFYALPFMRYVEEKLGAVIAFEENTNVYWEPIDEEEPFVGIAKKLMAHTGFGPSERRADAILDFVKRYKIDGVVHFSQICCRPFRGSVSVIREALNSADVPFLELSGDVLDSRNYSEGQLKIRMEAFIEVLQEKNNL